MLIKAVKIGKRGSGLWFRIPAAIVRDLDLKPGDEAQFTQIGEHEFELIRVDSLSGAMEKILTLSRVMPTDNEAEPLEPSKR
jgi:antitoxin component of MazEF toxin-antitoxin module